MADSNQHTVGSVELPLSTSFVTNIRTVADPLREALIFLLDAALTAELEDALMALAPSMDQFDGYAVGQVIDFEPSKAFVLENKVTFPLLAIYRVSSTIRNWTIDDKVKVCRWKVQYVLPDLGVFDFLNIHNLLNAAENTILTTLQDGKHPAYNDGYSILDPAEQPNGRLMITTTVNPVSSSYGYWQVINELVGDVPIMFPTVEVDIETEELVGYVTNYDAGSFDVLDGYVTHDDGYGEPFENLVVFHEPL